MCEYKNRMGEMERFVTVSAISQKLEFYEMLLIWKLREEQLNYWSLRFFFYFMNVNIVFFPLNDLTLTGSISEDMGQRHREKS